MNLKEVLIDLENKLWQFRLSRTKGGFVTVKEIQDKMRKDETIPTAIFHIERDTELRTKSKRKLF